MCVMFNVVNWNSPKRPIQNITTYLWILYVATLFIFFSHFLQSDPKKIVKFMLYTIYHSLALKKIHCFKRERLHV